MGKQKAKVAIIGTQGIPAKYGGFETLAEHLTLNLGNKVDITVYCSKSPFRKAKINSHNNSRLIYLPFKANGPQSIIYDIISLFHASFRNNVLLVLGVSGSIVFPFLKLLNNRKIVVNVDGIEYKREKWSKLAMWYLRFAEKVAMKYADIIISDNEGIKEYLKSNYNKETELITYGGDHTSSTALSNEVSSKYCLPNQYAFKVCRIEPENNIEIILKAFDKVKKYPLILIGNWCNSDYGMKLYKKYSKSNNLILLNPIYSQTTLDEIRSNCYVYVHGHSAGGTNPSLVEAMYLKLPVIAFDVDFNRHTTDNKAVFFSNSEQLVYQLTTLSNENLKSISNQLFKVAQKRYKWEKISEQYYQLF